ncbi:thioredoxin interacting protein b [Sinocyclocheilus rhinocerous]|uniref:Thioredoxin-interacting protein n=1 Tax=Sinocyclocheilus rhinocerous TaxID=307959 RepID=A0A673J1D0_9TELE|nr:PREDICTED: thioredoxin-interacting protein-like [Sinocyclocheilus rhinocerous]
MGVLTKKPKTFEVQFSDPNKSAYSGGDKVAGRVIVEVAEVVQISAVKLFGIGCAKVDYNKGKMHCRDEIEYLKYEEVLHLDHQPTDADGSITLRPGNRYEFMFGFELPQAGCLVSSYVGKFGSVQYYVKAVIERSSQPYVECKRYFEVVEPIDVNTQELMDPVTGAKQKKVTCMFIPDGSVSVSARIGRKGYCEGEDICIDAKFENSCSRIVVPKAAIIAKHIYRANGRTKEFHKKLTSVRGVHIISGMCDVWQGRVLPVPKLKPTILGCDIIHIDYCLRIYLHIPGSEKLILDLPLVIGTIPYNGMNSRTSSMSSQDSSDTSSTCVSLPSSPPSYSEISPDNRMDSSFIPLLDDYDEDDSPIFMRSIEYHLPPSPPAYTEQN